MSHQLTSGNYNAPRHQLHDPSQPLPGSDVPAAAQTQGYLPENKRLPVSDPAGATQQPTGQIGTEDLTACQSGKGQGAAGPGGFAAQHGSQGRTAFNSERPLGVAPTPEGGVAIGGQSDLPEGHAGFGDRFIGKTQKVVGKYTNNPEMHEKGELRETGGKAAAEGRARAAHD
ncbi:hypothetical protein BS17DRAFT_710360 [Gyrodon lividus]|nr:hypothetical protein BS17DRAFT_710360 [Gyrodon lividus]